MKTAQITIRSQSFSTNNCFFDGDLTGNSTTFWPKRLAIPGKPKKCNKEEKAKNKQQKMDLVVYLASVMRKIP